MNRAFVLMSTLVLAQWALAAPESQKGQTFGAPITMTTIQPLADAAVDAEVLVHGEIKKVCEKKGCWLTIKDSTSEMRMSFKNYGFFVPKDSGGKKVRAQGSVVEKKESVKDQKHYLKDAGASKEEVEAVKEPKLIKSFVASGVEIH